MLGSKLNHVSKSGHGCQCCSLIAPWINSYNTLPVKICTIWKARWKHSYIYVTFRFAGKRLGTNHKPVLWLQATLMCIVLVKKCDLQSLKLKRHKGMYKNMPFSNTSPKLSNKFQCIHHYIVNLWDICVGSIIRDWHHTVFATRCLIIIWALRQKYTWWRHQMETFSALLALCAGNSPVSGKFPAQR